MVRNLWGNQLSAENFTPQVRAGQDLLELENFQHHHQRTVPTHGLTLQQQHTGTLTPQLFHSLPFPSIPY